MHGPINIRYVYIIGLYNGDGAVGVEAEEIIDNPNIRFQHDQH